MTGTIAVLNGPNLNLLGARKPQVYGRDTLADVERLCAQEASRHGLQVDCRQSNHEGVIIDAVHELRSSAVGFVVNAGAWTHYSIGLRDALETIESPLMEVHISNVHAREEFRHHSYLSPIAAGIVIGCGVQGYAFAIARIATLTGSSTLTA